MNYYAEKDILSVFGASIDKPLMDKIVQILDAFLHAYPVNLVLRTRKEKNQPLAIGGLRCFAVFYPVRGNLTVFVGTMERDESGSDKPVIRFRNTNPLLGSLPTECKFKSRVRDWTCVQISEQIVDRLPHLMKAEADSLNSSLPSDEQSNPLSIDTLSSTGHSSPVFGWLGVAGLLVAFFAFLWLMPNGASEQVPTEKAPEIQVPQEPPKPATVPSKPRTPSKEFHFFDSNGGRVSASVFPAEQYGPGRLIVIFTPLQDGSDVNFHLLSLSSLHHVFGRHRGSFKLRDAYKMYDIHTNKRAIVWDITNPAQKFFCLPMIDIDTDKVVSLVVWLE